MIQIGSLLLTCAVAMVGIFYDTHDRRVRYVLAGLAITTLLFSVLIQIQAGRQADFNKRALENLIRASTPSEQFARAVTKIAISHASKKGLADCVVRHWKEEDGFRIDLVFTDESNEMIRGYFHFNHEEIAEWSLLEEKNLEAAIAEKMFSPYFSLQVFDKWDELCDWLGQLSKSLYPDSIRHGRFGISARADLNRIGVPCPTFVQMDPNDKRVEVLSLGAEKVPFLLFPEDKLMKLAGNSRMQAAAKVSQWLVEAWGRPTILGEPTAPAKLK